MIVDHVHGHPEALPVQALHGLLQLPDPDLSVRGIGGIGALRHVPVHGIIAPVKLRGISRLVHGTVIIDRHELHMGHAQLLQIRKPRGMDAVPAQGGIFAAEGTVFSPDLLREAAGRIPGKFLHMGFPDHLLRPVLRRQVSFPALRVRPAKVRRHAALSVDPAGLCVRVRGLYPFSVQLKDKIIIDPVKVLRRAVFPDAFFQPFHGKGRKGLPSASIPEQTQLRLFCEGTPDAENAFPGGPFPEGVFLENVFRVFIKKAQLHFVQIIPVKIRAFIDFFIFQSRPFHSALLFHASLSCFPHTLFRVFSRLPSRRFPSGPHFRPRFLSSCSPGRAPKAREAEPAPLPSCRLPPPSGRAQPFTAPDTPST